jgi:hypothetical protein
MSRVRSVAILTLILFAALCATALAQDVPESALTNTGVVKMVKAGLPESVVIRVIQMSRTSFDTSPNGLVDLRKHGASENVLNAVLDSWNAGGMPMAASHRTIRRISRQCEDQQEGTREHHRGTQPRRGAGQRHSGDQRGVADEPPSVMHDATVVARSVAAVASRYDQWK